MNQQIKINLTKVPGSFVRELKGSTGAVKRCLIVPLENSGLVVEGEFVYIKISAFEMKNPKSQTHICKLSLDHDQYNALSEDQKNALPIIGGIKELGSK